MGDICREKAITRLLHEWKEGNEDALNELITRVYDELRQLARFELRGEWKGNMQATDLVHQMFSSLVKKKVVDWQDRHHFFRIAARAMRRALIVDARRRNTEKRGQGRAELSFDEGMKSAINFSPETCLQVNDAMEALEKIDPGMTQIVELRFFGGFTVSECGEILNISEPTVKRKFQFARSWLVSYIEGT